jgi:AcrR family transcriptional regulator
VTKARKPGRPRSVEADQAILRTTVELLATEGLRGLSIEQVAERAGVGKTTIYRRWPTKWKLAEAALNAFFAQLEPPALPDTGNLRDDLQELARMRLGLLPITGAHLLLPRLAIESVDDPQLYRLVRKLFIEPERAVFVEIFRRGVERGEVRADLDLEQAADIFRGPLVFRLLMSRSDLKQVRAMLEPVIDFFVRGAAP